ncbi:MAG TPA: flagellar hook capping protein [Firmicutes bacterium]|jgi:flagellar basal-body rod modification protein FlgD|nr:flagellar hook capping protein [Bacillota bacterium]
MQVNSVTSAGSAAVGEAQVGRDTFLQLLAAQLRYQDPLKPLDNSEFMVQLAQFSALEQMQAVRVGVDLVREGLEGLLWLQAVELLGKEVAWQGGSGHVERVSWTTDGVSLQIGGHEVPLVAVTAIGLTD